MWRFAMLLPEGVVSADGELREIPSARGVSFAIPVTVRGEEMRLTGGDAGGEVVIDLIRADGTMTRLWSLPRTRGVSRTEFETLFGPLAPRLERARR
jgi:hypothetical protein